MRETFEQQTGQLSGIAHRWRIVEFVTGVIADARFGGVGEHKTDIRIMGQRQVRVIFAIDVQLAIHGANQTCVADRFALFIQTTNDSGIKSILGAQRRRKIAVDRTHYHHTGIEVGMFVKEINLPVNKSAQKVPFAELDDTFWILRSGKIATV